ncbi:MAG: hypothetical protein ACJA01_001678 [Saprospiraceae bacterium]|jgi:hypothetical protein
MNGFNIVMVITVILFARLGMRLLSKYFEMSKEDNEGDDSKLDNENQ